MPARDTQKGQRAHKIADAGHIKARHMHEQHVDHAAQADEGELPPLETREQLGQVIADARPVAQLPQAAAQIAGVEDQQAGDEAEGIGLRVRRQLQGHVQKKEREGIHQCRHADIGSFHADRLNQNGGKGRPSPPGHVGNYFLYSLETTSRQKISCAAMSSASCLLSLKSRLMPALLWASMQAGSCMVLRKAST